MKAFTCLVFVGAFDFMILLTSIFVDTLHFYRSCCLQGTPVAPPVAVPGATVFVKNTFLDVEADDEISSLARAARRRMALSCPIPLDIVNVRILESKTGESVSARGSNVFSLVSKIDQQFEEMRPWAFWKASGARVVSRNTKRPPLQYFV